MVRAREVSVCVQVLDVHIEPDLLHISWEVQVLVYFSDPSLKGTPEQTTGATGKVYQSSKKRKKKSDKKDLWESVPRQFFIANAVDIHSVRPDKFRVLNASLGTCKQTTHVRVRTYHPIDVREFPYDRQNLKLDIQATYPSDIVTFGRQPVFYLGNFIKGEQTPLSRMWTIECHGIESTLTPQDESFTSSSYAKLEVCISVKRKPGKASRVTIPFANICVFLTWTTIATNDSDIGFMILILTIVALVSLMLGSGRPNVGYMVAMDIYIRDCFLVGIFPVAFCHCLAALGGKFNLFVLDQIDMIRTGGVGLSVVLALGRFGKYKYDRMKLRYALDYEIQLRKMGQPHIDLPKNMSVFSLWEMNRFLKVKANPEAQWLGSSWFDRSDAEDDDEEHARPSSPYKQASPKRKKLPPIIKKPNFSSSAEEGEDDTGRMSGQEEWTRGKEEKKVTFQPFGGLQDNKIMNKKRPSSASIRQR
jgi:hypothetical protein